MQRWGPCWDSKNPRTWKGVEMHSIKTGAEEEKQKPQVLKTGFVPPLQCAVFLVIETICHSLLSSRSPPPTAPPINQKGSRLPGEEMSLMEMNCWLTLETLSPS